MEFAHPPPVHISNANMSIPPPMMGINQPPPNQKYDRPNNFNNITQINSNNQGRPSFRPFINIQRPLPGPLGNMTLEDFDGKRLRKSVMRKTVDYNSAIITALQNRVWQRDYRDRRALQPDVMYYPGMMPPPSYPDNPINCVTTRFVKTATNKMRCPIFCMAWTPEGRRLVTGASSGEFTLWNGLTFNFETILQAHDSPVRCMVWSHSDSWMVTGDHAGYVKYWQSNMNNVKMFQAHKEALRGISFSPSDAKFVTCSDDGTLRIWDFLRYQEERVLRGHGADVKCVHWHPQRSLIISGSKDNQQPIKLWDPKSGQSLATLHAHKSTVMDLKWNENGNWLITASRDNLVKLFDLRNLNQEIQTFRGHKREASSVAWHPVHEGLFSSGGADGSIMFWHVGADKEVGAIEQAHDSIVWTLAWHPLGHILCSGSNDHTSKFWTRNRPGDLMRDKYNLNTLPAGLTGIEELDVDEPSIIPGMGPDDKVEYTMSSESGTTEIPGLDLEVHGSLSEDKIKTKKVPYSKPIPRNFQAQWNETIPSEDDISSSLNDGLFPENAAGAVPLQKLASNANGLIMCGKYVAVEPGSKLEAAIAEGPKYLYEFIVSGQVPELMEVIDQIREEYRLYNKEYLDEDSEEFQESVEPSKRSQHLHSEDFFDNSNYNSKPNYSEGRRTSSRFSDVDDQDMRHSNTPFNNSLETERRDLNEINYRQQNSDVDFRQRDQDMRHLDMPDQDFRPPFNRDNDYRRFDEEVVDNYDEGDDYDDDGNNWHNDNFPNGQFGNNRNFNPNFQGFRQPFNNRNEPIWQPPPHLQDNDNFRNIRGRRGNFRNNARPNPWIHGPPQRGGPNMFKGPPRNKISPRINRGRY